MRDDHGDRAARGSADDTTEEHRSVLLGLGYRMLGSLADAEDAVQETYARWHRLPAAEREAIESPRAWLMKAESRIALDMLGSARSRREHYVGEWLPEPVPDDGRWTSQSATTAAEDPSDRVSMDESVSMALLVVLESMTPAERVAFVLHDVFQYTFAEVGEIVGRTPEASRQLASSARRRVRSERRTRVDSAQHLALVRSFKAAWDTGDIDSLVRLLDPDAVIVADGGGVVQAFPRPVRGADRIGRLIAHGREVAPDIVLTQTVVNGEPGLVATGDGEVLAVFAISMSASGRIDRVWVMRNPEKLRAWI